MTHSHRHRLLVSLALPRGFFLLEGSGEPVLRIGRGRDCQIHLLGDAVSRRHAELVLADGEFAIRDVGSANGTHLNESAIPRGETRRLKESDRITIGPHVLRYVSVEGTREELAHRFEPAHADTDRIALTIKRKPVSLAGTFAGAQLVEACQLIELNRHSGELRVTTASGFRGALRFREGVIVEAHCGIKTGEGAAHDLLSFGAGEYAFEEATGAPPVGPLRIYPTALAMDILSHRDEAAKPAAAEPLAGFADEAPPRPDVQDFAPEPGAAPRPAAHPEPRATGRDPRPGRPTGHPLPATSRPTKPFPRVAPPATSPPATRRPSPHPPDDPAEHPRPHDGHSPPT